MPSLKSTSPSSPQSRRISFLQPSDVQTVSTASSSSSDSISAPESGIEGPMFTQYIDDFSEEAIARRLQRARELEASMQSALEKATKAFNSPSSSDSWDTADMTVPLAMRLDRDMNMNDGTNIARALAVIPPNILNPESYAEVIRSFAQSLDCEYKEWTSDQLKAMGCGAFVAVTQGNRAKTDRLVRLVWKPKPKANAKSIDSSTRVTLADAFRRSSSDATTGGTAAKRPVVLVGKGVCYDTGGVNVKTANSMKTMKHDMAGSSAALGVFWTLVKNRSDMCYRFISDKRSFRLLY